MVLVRGLAATATGELPTGMVAVTLQAETAARDVLAGDVDVAAAVVVATGASEATAAATKIAARWVSLMMSCLLAWHLKLGRGLDLGAACRNRTDDLFITSVVRTVWASA